MTCNKYRVNLVSSLFCNMLTGSKGDEPRLIYWAVSTSYTNKWYALGVFCLPFGSQIYFLELIFDVVGF